MCGDLWKWTHSTLTADERVQMYSCSFKIIQQEAWPKVWLQNVLPRQKQICPRVWLLNILRREEVITFICSLYRGKEVFAFFFLLDLSI